MMKKRIFIITFVSIWIMSCGKMYEHKPLDGMWQMRSIEPTEGEIKEVNDLFYSFQKHTINVRKTNGAQCFGQFEYTGDSIYVHMMGTKIETIKSYGMNDTLQNFGVITLTKTKMILKSNYARMVFRKY